MTAQVGERGLVADWCLAMAGAIKAEDSVTVKKLARETEVFLFDCDGVLWGSGKIFPGVSDTLKKLQSQGKKIIYVTNNSTKSRSEYLEKIRGYGLQAEINEVYCTAYTCAKYLKHKVGEDEEVYVVGNCSIGTELDTVGINHFGIGPDDTIKSSNEAHKLVDPLKKNVKAVIVGFDDYFNYSKITKAISYLANPETIFVATNMDSNFPVTNSEYTLPGTGSLITAVAFASGRQPDVICGKPDSAMMDCIKKECEFDQSRAIMVGDRLDTDIQFGNRNGLKTLLVLSGVTNTKTLEQVFRNNDKEKQPTYYASSLSEFGQYL